MLLKMSLNDILQIERERVNRERVVLTTVYDRMKNRINNSVKVKAKECIYKIPEFIPGYPLIDTYKTMNYLLNKLKKEGFIVIQLTLLDLYITWDPAKIRQLDQISFKKEDKIDKQFWNSGNLNHSQKKNLNEKEFERANEDFINTLVVSKKKDNIF